MGDCALARPARATMVIALGRPRVAAALTVQRERGAGPAWIVAVTAFVRGSIRNTLIVRGIRYPNGAIASVIQPPLKLPGASFLPSRSVSPFSRASCEASEQTSSSPSRSPA